MKACCFTFPNYFIITEYINLGNLYEILHDKNIELNWRRKLSIAFQIANGLEFLHEKSFVHGDVKSLNILLDSNFNVKICDFNYTHSIKEKNILTQHGVNIF